MKRARIKRVIMRITEAVLIGALLLSTCPSIAYADPELPVEDTEVQNEIPSEPVDQIVETTNENPQDGDNTDENNGEVNTENTGNSQSDDESQNDDNPGTTSTDSSGEPTLSDTVTLSGIPTDYFDTSVSSLNDGTVYIDGIKCAPSIVSEGTITVTIPESLVGTAKTAVVFKYKSNNVAKWMKVFRLDWNSEDGSVVATEIPEFEDLIEYRGFSLRVADEEKGIKPGIRARTGVKVTVRDALTSENGLTSGDGESSHTYHLYEYGQLYINPSPWKTGSYNLICGEADNKNVSLVKCYYRDDAGVLHDIYKIEADTLTGENRYYFANVLPMENLTVGKIENDRTFRAYVTVKDETGEEFTIYGPINTKSMYEVADGLLKNPTETNVGAVGSTMRTYVNAAATAPALADSYFIGIGDSIMQGCDGSKSSGDGESGFGTNMTLVDEQYRIPWCTANKLTSLMKDALDSSSNATLYKSYGALIKNDYFNGGATYSYPGSNSGIVPLEGAVRDEFTGEYDVADTVWVKNDVLSIAKKLEVDTVVSPENREKTKYIMVMAGHNDWAHSDQGQWGSNGEKALLGDFVRVGSSTDISFPLTVDNNKNGVVNPNNEDYIKYRNYENDKFKIFDENSHSFTQDVYNTIAYLDSICGEENLYPNATVLVISPIQCVKKSGGIVYNGSTFKNSSTGVTFNDYVGRIETIATCGGFDHVQYLNLYYGWTPGIYGKSSNFSQMLPDGVHPSQAGYESISEYIANWIFEDLSK